MNTTERRITRIITTQTGAPRKYDNGITKGWAVPVFFITEDGTGPYEVNEKYRLKREAVECQQRHLHGSTPKWEMTVTTDETGRAILWTECYGQPHKGSMIEA
jgi:hypothetical protein